MKPRCCSRLCCADEQTHQPLRITLTTAGADLHLCVFGVLRVCVTLTPLKSNTQLAEVRRELLQRAHSGQLTDNRSR